MSFAKGIRLFVELPFVDDLEALNHKIGVVMKYDTVNFEAFSLELENVFSSRVQVNPQQFQVEFENKLETILPVGNMQVAWLNNDQLRVTFHNQNFHHEFGIMVDPESHLSISHVSTTDAGSDTLQLYLYWNNNVELVVIRNGDQKTYKLETEAVGDFFEKLQNISPIFQGSWSKQQKRGVYTMGFEFDGQRYVIQVELAQFETAVQFNIRYEKPESRNEFVTVLTLEAGLGDNHQIEFFVEYHDGLRQILDLELVSYLEQTKYWVEKLAGSFNNFVESIVGNEVAYDTSSTSVALKEIISFLDNLIGQIEATNPKAAISGEPFTLWDIISGQMNLEKINLDENLQIAREYITEKITNAADQMLKEQEDALRYGSEIERQFFKVYKKIMMLLANQTANQILQTVNLLSTKPSSYVVIENNKIFVTVPLPDYNLPGHTTSIVDSLSEADFVGNFWKAIAILNPSKGTKPLGFLEVEAEIVGKFVRQFDGKWIELNDESYDVFADIPSEHLELMTINVNVTGDTTRIVVGPEARNLEFGIFGVPDSEVFSDNIEHLSADAKWLDKVSNPDPAFDLYWSAHDSPAVPCHAVIDTSPYRMMTSDTYSLCQAAQAYKRRCMNYGAIITMPNIC